MEDESKTRPTTSSRSTTSSKKNKPTIRPVPPPVRVTAQDLFGYDSEEEPKANHGTSMAITPLHSVFVQTLARGVSKQVMTDKKGTHFFELKVYKCSDIEKVPAVNRWRHAVVSIKSKTDNNTDLWQQITNVVNTSRKEFRGVPNNFFSQLSL